jgi:hypothetical protein
VIATRISQASAALLAAGGLALLFASDVLLPRLVAGFPAAGAWLGQLLAAAWLGVAALNWLSRSALLGGIYGRPVVAANAALHFVSAAALLDVAAARGAGAAVRALFAAAALLAAAYGWLLLRGPFERDVARHRGTR